MFNNIPAGYYKVHGKELSKSHAIDADIYSTGDAFCDAHPKLAGMGER